LTPFLAFIIAVYVVFIVTLAGVSIWSNRP